MFPRMGRRTSGRRPIFFGPVVGALLLALAVLASEAVAMWAQMSEQELIQKSDWIVVGEWQGQAPARMAGAAGDGDVGVVAVREVLKGRRDATLALVAVRGATQPVSSSDLRFNKGDRGIWLLRLRSPSEPAGPYLVDNPQRFLRDSPENSAAAKALRQALRP